jgi:hypothetical protein
MPLYNPTTSASSAAAAVDYTAPVSITGAATLNSTAFGKDHAVSGTTADYTITLPTPSSGDVGKLIGFRMSSALTKLVTLDAGATRSIDTDSQTRVMWRDETCMLLCVGTTGVCWVKVAGKSIPMLGVIALSASQSIPSGNPTAIALNLSVADRGGMVDTANNRLLVRRPGDFRIVAQGYLDVGVANRFTCDIRKNGTMAWSSEESSASGSSYAVPQPPGLEPLVTNDALTMACYQDTGGSRNVLGSGTVRYTFLYAEEVLKW